MGWWGKLAGGVLGYVLDGAAGTVLGVVSGHLLDLASGTGVSALRRFRAAGFFGEQDPQVVQQAFFHAAFSVMGHLSKADGRVTESEIAYARQVMDQLELTPSQRREAIRLFTEGKHPDFPLDDTLRRFRRGCGRQRELVQLFVGIQLRLAYADGRLCEAEQELLARVRARLRFPQAAFDELESLVHAERQRPRRRPEPDRSRSDTRRSPLHDAYALLGIAADASNEAVKQAYRRLLNRHHPDKLAAKGAPEETMQLASRKTHEIRRAYELIRATRGF